MATDSYTRLNERELAVFRMRDELPNGADRLTIGSIKEARK